MAQGLHDRSAVWWRNIARCCFSRTAVWWAAQLLRTRHILQLRSSHPRSHCVKHLSLSKPCDRTHNSLGDLVLLYNIMVMHFGRAWVPASFSTNACMHKPKQSSKPCFAYHPGISHFWEQRFFAAAFVKTEVSFELSKSLVPYFSSACALFFFICHPCNFSFTVYSLQKFLRHPRSTHLSPAALWWRPWLVTWEATLSSETFFILIGHHCIFQALPAWNIRKKPAERITYRWKSPRAASVVWFHAVKMGTSIVCIGCVCTLLVEPLVMAEAVILALKGPMVLFTLLLYCASSV